MPSSRPLDRLGEVADNCERIQRYIGDMDFAAYAADQKTKDAVERCLQRISEAATKLGHSLDALYPEVNWKGARGIGNPLRHQYDQIHDADIWDGIVNDIPQLYHAAMAEIARLKALPED
ncbi:HepT-like ribonuclease domain-containing protein [Paramagnetospirillum kuznetsovii]|nr:HepT-like ribonuclease domain-containing protein [Paramagnetospirillum kuznetsovii]